MKLWGLGVQTWSAKQGRRTAGAAEARRRMSTLWHGRFEGGPADDLLAFTVSLPFDRRLAGRRPRPARAPTCAGCVRAGLLSDAEAADVLAALDQVETELAEERFAFAAVRRGHPHRRRAAGHRDRRSGRGQAAHRPQPQRPGGHRPAPVHQAGARPRGRAGARAAGGAARSGHRGRRRLPAGLHPPPAGPAGAAGPPPAGPRLGPGARRRPPGRLPAPRSTCRRSAPARWPGRRCRSTPRRSPPTSGSRRVFENSLDAVSDRDFVAEALFVLTLIGLHLSRHRRGDRAVVERRVRLRAPRRRLLDRQLDAAAEEEPRHRRAGPGQERAASSAT